VPAIETERGVFRARDEGPEDGRVVLLLHGFPESSACWHHQLAALADELAKSTYGTYLRALLDEPVPVPSSPGRPR